MNPHLQRLDVRIKSIPHDSDQFGVDFILMFLIILKKINGSPCMVPETGEAKPTYPLQFIKLHEHYRLLRTKMPSEGLSHIGDQLKHNGKRLRCKR
jgi:hypothetical protein